MRGQDLTKRYFKDVLRKYRLASGMTQHQLAGLAQISVSFLGAMETGVKWPNVDMLINLAEALNKRPSELLDVLMAEAHKHDQPKPLKSKQGKSTP